MNNREYWMKRAIALEYYAQQEANEILDKIHRLYRAALENIDEEIQKFKRKLGKMTGAVTEAELNELLRYAERDKSYSELRELLRFAETADEQFDIMNRIDAQAYGTRITRLDSVGNKILSELTTVAAQEKILCKELFSNTYQGAYYTNIYNLAEGYNAGVAFDVLPRRAINKVLNAPWNGDDYSSRIWKHSQEFTNQVQETVIKGLMTGQSRSKMASELMQYTDSTRYVAERLVRTETAHFLAEGQKKAYEAAGIEKYRFLAALSERSCEICAALDSKVFSLDEATEGVNYPPMHPNCRCVTITADAKLSTRMARDPVTGKNYKVDGNITFTEWKESLSDEQKQAFELHIRRNRNKSADKKQYDRYIKLLGTENMPKTFDKFQDLKYNNPDGWSELKYAYRTVNRYEIEGFVSVDKVIELDRAAWYTKQTGFEYSNLTGKDRRHIKELASSGNCATMDFNGKIYFSHSRVGNETSLEYKSYIGNYPLVSLLDRRRFSVKNLGDGVNREYDTEAKFLEFVASQKKARDTFVVTILSEKHICPSCEGVVEQFKEMFPNSTVNIISGKRGYNNSENGLHTYKHRKKVKKSG